MLSHFPKLASVQLRLVIACAVLQFCAGSLVGQTRAQQTSTAPNSVVHPNPSPSPSRSPMLLLRSDADCRYSIDGVPAGELTSGAIKTIPIDLGEHLFEAFTKDGTDKWETVVDIEKPLQKVVLIGLAKVRVARLAALQEAEQLREEIRTKQQKAAQLDSERKTLAGRQMELEEQRVAEQKAKQEAQAVINTKRKEILASIEALQLKMRTENDLAASDEQAAASGERGAGAVAGSTNGFAQLLGAVNSTGASMKRDSAQAHRNTARELQNQIDDKQRELAHLGQQ